MMYRKYFNGIIEVITGPMFSGKSEELIKRIKILTYAKINTLVIKPTLDKRWSKLKIHSRAGLSFDTKSCENVEQILKEFNNDDYQAIAIDEAQFFQGDLAMLAYELASKGIRVIISGLDTDYTGKPFGQMPNLLAVADKIDKQCAVCNKCRRAATMTFRLTKDKNQVAIGDKEYEPRCRECHNKGMLKK